MSKLALVLAGGGSLGSYEVGAIEALEELGFKFDIVTGTSIGAINAAFVCNGQTKALRKLWEAITPEGVMADGVNLSVREFSDSTKLTFLKELGGFWKSYLTGGKIGADISPFRELVKQSIDIDACYNSPIQYGIVTTQMPRLKLIDVDMHTVAREEFLPFIHASSACFPIFPVEKIGKKFYVDGFFKDNLPIRLAFKMGATDVIAIDMRLFSLEPQNTFYLSLPNVSYVAPYTKMGSLMDFDQNVIRNNMKLGYLDTMKRYGKVMGYVYSFKPFPVPKGFLAYVLNNYSTDADYITSLLKEGERLPRDETGYFVRAMEVVAERLGIQDYYSLFTFDEFRELIRKRIAETLENSRPKMMEIKERFLSFTQSSRKGTLYRFLSDFTERYLGIEADAMVCSRILAAGEES